MTQQIESVVSLPVEAILESPTNPRKVFTGMEELTASVAAKGIISPVVVRPIVGGAPGSPFEVAFELCFGHRRMRAARAAGLATVPAIVRAMDDAELVEAQLVENIQRADITELEEADAYAALIAQGYTGPRIVAATGKTRAYVYARLKLAELGEAGRQAIQEGKLAASSALLIARVPPKLQKVAIDEVLKEAEYYDVALTVRDVREILDSHVFRRLNRAQWSLDDAELLPSAGACSSCPKSSLGDPELAAQGSADVCTDPACWDAKVSALYELRVRKAEERGGRAITDEEKEDGGVDGRDVLAWKSPTGESFEEVAEKAGVEYAPVVVEQGSRVYELVDEEVYHRVIESTDEYKAQETAREKARATSQKRMEAEDKKREAQAGKLRQIWDAVLERGEVPAWALSEFCEQMRHLLPYDRQDTKLETYGALAAAFTTIHLNRAASSSRSGFMSLDEALVALGRDGAAKPAEEVEKPLDEAFASIGFDGAAKPAKKIKKSLAVPPASPATKTVAKPSTTMPAAKTKSAKAKPAAKSKPSKAKPAKSKAKATAKTKSTKAKPAGKAKR